MNTFEDRLKLLMDFCKNDPVFSIIHTQLINVPNVDFDVWHKKVLSTTGCMAGSGKLIFPTNLDERMSLMYQLLDKVNENEIELISFAYNFFSSSSIQTDSILYAFNEAIVEPLARELSYRIEDLEDKLPEDNEDIFSLANIQIIHNANNVIQQSASGNNIKQSANIESDSKLGCLFDELRQELQKLIKDKEKLENALQVLETSAELARNGGTKLPSVKALLESLGTLGNISSIVSSILAVVATIG